MFICDISKAHYFACTSLTVNNQLSFIYTVMLKIALIVFNFNTERTRNCIYLCYKEII